MKTGTGSKLIQIMREQAKQQVPTGIEFATVVSVDIKNRKMTIRIDNMKDTIDESMLIVCESLWEHDRIYSSQANVSSSVLSTQPDHSHPNGGGAAGAHTHSLNSFKAVKQTETLDSNLKEGVRVAVIALPEGQKYLIIDKVVELDDDIS